MERIFKYKSDIQDIPRIRRDLTEVSRQWEIPGSESHQIGVIIEELFANIVRFAYEDQQIHPVEIRLHRWNDHIKITIIDDGIPFNPMEYDRAPTPDPAASDIGGMGLILVKTFSDAIDYRRNDQKNHLEITKKIRTGLDSATEDKNRALPAQ